MAVETMSIYRKVSGFVSLSTFCVHEFCEVKQHVELVTGCLKCQSLLASCDFMPINYLMKDK